MRLAVPAVLLLLGGSAMAQEGSEDAKSLVKKAIAFYKESGRASMIKEVTSKTGALRNGTLYVFVYDISGVVVAHGQITQLIGTNLFNAKDPAGKPFVQDRIKLVQEKGSGWQDYSFKDPTTGRISLKKAYVELFDGLIFGCGTYRR